MRQHFWSIFEAKLHDRFGQTAIAERHRSWSWGDLDRMTAELDGILRKRVPPGGVVVHRCKNRLADLLAYLACLRGGRIDVPIDSGLCEREASSIALQLGDAGSVDDVLDTWPTRKLQGYVEAVSPQPSADNGIGLILWTSGTTANPKGVCLRNDGLVQNARAKLLAVPESPDDIRLTSLPIAHAYARTCDLGTWLLSGCTLLLGLGLSAWDGVFRRPTIANVVPALAGRLLHPNREVATSGLRLLGCGGAGLNDVIFDAWKRRSVPVIQGYGLTESGPVIASATPENVAPGLVGPFVEGWEHRITDGRLFVRGEMSFAGYFNDPQSTSTRIDSEGWLDTGDLVEIDRPSGQLRVLGRADDVIVLQSGVKVHPEALERGLRQLDGVQEAYISLLGGRLVAHIAGEVARSSLDSWAAANCTRFRPPEVRRWNITAAELEILKTSKGTLRRNAAQDWMENHP